MSPVSSRAKRAVLGATLSPRAKSNARQVVGWVCAGIGEGVAFWFESLGGHRRYKLLYSPFPEFLGSPANKSFQNR